MSRPQIIVLVLALILGLGLYFAPIKAPKSEAVDRTRAMEMQITDKSGLLRKAKGKYKPEQLLDVQRFQDLVGSTENDSLKSQYLEGLSGAWYRLGEPALAGMYAKDIANIRQDENSWAIAGTTFALGIKKYEDQETRTFCREKAVEALENAISINPSNSQHRVNLALCYVELPLEAQPMKGIMMLRDVLDKNPNDVGALTQLGLLSIRTGQYDNAIKRLEMALGVEPNNKQVIQLLVSAYDAKGDLAGATKYKSLLDK